MTMKAKTGIASPKSSQFPKAIRSNLKQVRMRLGGPNKAKAPAYASQIGAHLGNHSDMKGRTGPNPATMIEAGKALSPTPLGNQTAASCKQGPGGGRVVMKAAMQGTHGAPAPGSPTKKRNSFD